MESLAKPRYGCNSAEELKIETVTPELIRRIESKITINPETGCWEWTGCKTRKRNGHGRIHYGRTPEGKQIMLLVHRLMYAIVVGPVREGENICHRCDNRPCVNPAHLFLGTNQDNVDDREAKGRNVVKKRSQHYKAKLSEAQVAEIRRRVVITGTGRYGGNCGQLAREFGVQRTQIANIFHNRSWKE